jgi:uncharacterized protein
MTFVSMLMTIEKKHQKVIAILQELEQVIVAYSGGVDSALLAKIARDTLGEKAIAITLSSPNHPVSELEEAKAIAKMIGIEHRIITEENLDLSWFTNNPPNRCYICKKSGFQAMIDYCQEEKIPGQIIEGSNYDDLDDHRPGFKAIKELAIRSPLLEAKLTKKEIRELAKKEGLPCWNKTAFACLATRFPFGEEITKENLTKVSQAEESIRQLGLEIVRVRVHGKLVRIEVPVEAMTLLIDNRATIIKQLQELGYQYITIDLAGYQKGSMNKT